MDCYDALTSDRPYRPRLSDETATSILLQRRGTMYDPLVVDTFVRVHRSLASPEAISPAQSATYQDIARLSAPEARETTRAETTRKSIDRAVTGLVSWSFANGGTDSLSDRAEGILLVVLSALDTCAGLIATYDVDRDDLVISAARGLGEASLKACRIGLGEHLTGWVAANGRPMLNSDAALDLAALVPEASPALTLCLSVPLFRESESLIGVLSLYSAQHFTTDQLDIACLLATSMASALAPSTASRSAAHQ